MVLDRVPASDIVQAVPGNSTTGTTDPAFNSRHTNVTSPEPGKRLGTPRASSFAALLQQIGVAAVGQQVVRVNLSDHGGYPRDIVKRAPMLVGEFEGCSRLPAARNTLVKMSRTMAIHLYIQTGAES